MVKIERTRADHRVATTDAFAGVERQDPPDPWVQFRRELNRSRRYGHELALLWLGPRDDEEVVAEALWATIQRLTRDVDCSWVADGRLFVLLPESNRTGAENLVGRLAAAEPAMFARLEARIAAFPEEGLTSGALLGAVAADRSSVEAFDLGRQTLDGESTLVGRLLRQMRVQRAGAPTGLTSEPGS